MYYGGHLLGAPLNGRLLASPTHIKIRLEKLARYKHYSLLQKSINYEQKKFYNIGPWWTPGANVRCSTLW
jgi:hypothetical protein